MKHDIDHIQKLLVEKMAGTISEEDNSLVEHVLEIDGSARLLWEVLSEQFNSLEGEDFLKGIDTNDAWLRVIKHLGEDEYSPLPKKTIFFELSRINIRKMGIAATVLLAVSIGCYFWLNHNGNESRVVQNRLKSPVVQTGVDRNKVVLTLANGETIVLDSAENGVLMKTENIQVSKTTDGQLLYQVTEDHSGDQNAGLNTITTPFGGQYQIILPDGSEVWLNTASSLTFPTAFKEGRREVKLIGEAYFEVTKSEGTPFIVKSKLGEIEVLGTDFNVMAYEDEQEMKTTLLEGSVRIVGAKTGSRMLKPGEQAILDSKQVSVKSIDAKAEIAWKNNLFQFNETSIEAIMRQASRWYNIDVKYAGRVPNRSFTGKISREVDVAEFLEMLKYTGVDFKLEDDYILVL